MYVQYISLILPRLRRLLLVLSNKMATAGMIQLVLTGPKSQLRLTVYHSGNHVLVFKVDREVAIDPTADGWVTYPG